MIRTRVLVLAIALCSSFACKKDPKETGPSASPRSTITPENAGDPTIGQTGGAPSDPAPGDPLTSPPHDLPATEAPRDNIDIPTGEQFVPGAPAVAPVAPPGDPLEGSIATAKAGAVPCFAKLPPGDWTATLVVTVTPTGTVTRSEVEPGNVQDASVISCLKTYAANLSFAKSEGRTVRVEVRVKG